jgi:hypothetical protein
MTSRPKSLAEHPIIFIYRESAGQSIGIATVTMIALAR